MNSALKTLLRKDMREQVKTYRLWVVLALFLFFAITAPLVTKHLPDLIPKTEQFEIIMAEPTLVDAAAQYAGYIVQMGMLLVILLGMGTIAGERSQGLLPMVLSKPVRRRHVLASKVLINGGMLVGALVLATAVFYGYTVLLFAYFPAGGAALSIVPMAAFILFVLSLTVFWSVVTSSSITAGGLSLLSVLVLTAVPPLFSSVKRFSPYYLMDAGKSIAVGGAGFGEVLPSLLVTAALIAALLWASAYIFEKRDI